MLKNISWTMSNLCNGVSDAHWDKIMLSLPKFAQLVYYNDEEILKVRVSLDLGAVFSSVSVTVASLAYHCSFLRCEGRVLVAFVHF